MTEFDEYDQDVDDDDEDLRVTCRRCGKTGLWWYHDGREHMLMEDRPNGSFAVHICKTQAPVSHFDDEP